MLPPIFPIAVASDSGVSFQFYLLVKWVLIESLETQEIMSGKMSKYSSIARQNYIKLL